MFCQISVTAISNEIRKTYAKKYSGIVTEICHTVLPARLVALTTTSAYGRSSIYNRLTYDKRSVAYSIGFTEGYGSFHLAPLYTQVCNFLKNSGQINRGGFGVGPRIMWQNYRRVFRLLNLPSNLLKHGVKREAFLFPLASNLDNYLNGKSSRPIFYHQSFEEIAEWWRNRWLLPRSDRIESWRAWDKEQIKHMLIIQPT